MQSVPIRTNNNSHTDSSNRLRVAKTRIRVVKQCNIMKNNNNNENSSNITNKK